jgi:hypothetical protein
MAAVRVPSRVAGLGGCAGRSRFERCWVKWSIAVAGPRVRLMSVRPDLPTMIKRAAALRDRTRAGAAAERLLAEIEDTLSERYTRTH